MPKSSAVDASLSRQQLYDKIDRLNHRVSELESLSTNEKDRLYGLARQLKLGFWEWDEINEEATYYSQEMADTFGVSLEELKDRLNNLDGFYDCIHPHDLESYRQNNDMESLNLSPRNRSHSFEYRIICPGGEIRHVQEHFTSIFDEAGRAIETYGVVQDITEFRHTQDAVERGLDRYTSLVDQLPLGIQELDYSGLKKGLDELFTNPAGEFRAYLEAHPEELPGLVRRIRVTSANKTLLDIHESKSLQEFSAVEEDVDEWWNEQWVNYFLDEIEAFLEKDKFHTGEFVDTKADNITPFFVRQISRVVKGYEDNWERVIFVIEDISERKRNESALIEAKTVAEKANKAKSEFLSSMSHELRTPLNAIMGFAQLLELRHSGNEKEKLQLRRILDASEHLLSLINDVLDLSRIEAGKTNLVIETVSLDSIICDSLNWATDLAASRKVSLHYNPESCRDILLEVDPIRLKQIFINIFSNAIKYNHKGGNVTINCSQNDNGVNIAVSDTGIGIPQERLNELFQPFNRLGLESGPIEGSGIGLVITQELVELMNGTINVESTRGEGSTFTLSLPLGGIAND